MDKMKIHLSIILPFKHRKPECILAEKLHESSAWLLTVFLPFFLLFIFTHLFLLFDFLSVFPFLLIASCWIIFEILQALIVVTADTCLFHCSVPPPMSPSSKSVSTPSEAGSQDSGDGAVGSRYVILYQYFIDRTEYIQNAKCC